MRALRELCPGKGPASHSGRTILLTRLHLPKPCRVTLGRQDHFLQCPRVFARCVGERQLSKRRSAVSERAAQEGKTALLWFVPFAFMGLPNTRLQKKKLLKSHHSFCTFRDAVNSSLLWWGSTPRTQKVGECQGRDPRWIEPKCPPTGE